MDRSDIKLRVHEILAERGMTCRQLAIAAGKSPQYVNSILNDPRCLSLNALILLANTLGVEFVELFQSPQKE